MAKASDNVFPYLHLAPAAAPASPAAGSQRLYLDSGDGNKLKRKDSAGAVTTIEGSGSGAVFVGAAAIRTTTQAIANSTVTAVQFDGTDLYDTSAIHDPATNNTRFTVPSGKGGVWRFTGSVEWDSNATGARLLEWAKNGVAFPGYYGGDRRNAVTGTVDTFHTATVDLLLAAADYIELMVHQNSGASRNVVGAYATCQYLGAP